MAVLGVGVNDADYSVGRYVAGRQVLCPFYRVWADMIRRCYDEKYIRKYPSYKNAVVCDEWLDSFMAFKSWMEKQDWQGKHLDKDVLGRGLKAYSPATCAFVLGSTNQIVDTLNKPYIAQRESTRWRATITNGKKEPLGTFDTKAEALWVWRQAKALQLLEIAKVEADMRIKIMVTYISNRLAFANAGPLPGGV